MKPSFNDRLIAYLVLLSGLAISGVAEYYSIMGLMAIYPAAIIPIVIMGVVLGIGKISGTVWLKQNWEWSPFFLKAYVLPAIIALMLITSLGVFGFLSKAHSDQSLVSGDVQSKIAVYDTKIQTAKENIDANRKALKQMDEAVDQVMGRSSDEKGADKAVGIRRSQQKERARLQSEIAAEQKTIAALNEEAAPIRTEVRKVEAEVGPIKYIAHLLYGENPDANILEKAVIWVTVLIVIVLDPLAVVLLLASQYSFQRFRELEEEELTPVYVADVGESPTVEEKEAEGDSPVGPEVDIVSTGATVTEPETPVPVEQWNSWIAEAEKAVEAEKADKHAYLNQPFVHFKNLTPMVAKKEAADLVEPDDEPLSDEEVKEIVSSVVEQYTPAYEADDGPLTDEQIEQLQEIANEDLPTGKVVTINTLFPDMERPGDYIKKPTYDFTQLQPGQEYVLIDGQNMHVRAAKSIYDQAPIDRDRPNFTETIEPTGFGSYVQNEEQGISTKWNRVISEAEYREQALAKNNDTKDNTNNPT